MDKALSGIDLGQIEVSVDLGGLEVYGDPMMEKVFANLVDNTLRHGEKTTKIKVSCQAAKDGLTLIYEDDGVGIKQEEKSRIFERGFGKNTGLGLFLVRLILNVTRIGIVENGIEGQGVRFEMTLPDGMFRLPD